MLRKESMHCKSALCVQFVYNSFPLLLVKGLVPPGTYLLVYRNLIQGTGWFKTIHYFVELCQSVPILRIKLNISSLERG